MFFRFTFNYFLDRSLTTYVTTVGRSRFAFIEFISVTIDICTAGLLAHFPRLSMFSMFISKSIPVLSRTFAVLYHILVAFINSIMGRGKIWN